MSVHVSPPDGACPCGTLQDPPRFVREKRSLFPTLTAVEPTAKLKQRAKGDFKGHHYKAALIVQAASWYLCS